MAELTDTVTIPGNPLERTLVEYRADGKVVSVKTIEIPTYHMASAWPADAPDCGACEHPAAEHCRECGCGRGVGTRDECICARYVAELFPCEHCGHVFKYRHEWQNHVLPRPSCRAWAGLAAAGKYADAANVGAPLAGLTAGNARDRRQRTRRAR